MGLVTYCERCKGETRPYSGYGEQPCRRCLQADITRLREENKRLKLVECAACGFEVPYCTTKEGRGDARICIDGTMLGCYASGLEIDNDRLREMVRTCRKQIRQLDVGGHMMQSWPDFCADTERWIQGAAKAADGKEAGDEII